MKQLSVYNIFCKIHFCIHVTQVNLGINLFPKLKQLLLIQQKVSVWKPLLKASVC